VASDGSSGSGQAVDGSSGGGSMDSMAWGMGEMSGGVKHVVAWGLGSGHEIWQGGWEWGREMGGPDKYESHMMHPNGAGEQGMTCGLEC